MQGQIYTLKYWLCPQTPIMIAVELPMWKSLIGSYVILEQNCNICFKQRGETSRANDGWGMACMLQSHLHVEKEPCRDFPLISYRWDCMKTKTEYHIQVVKTLSTTYTCSKGITNKYFSWVSLIYYFQCHRAKMLTYTQLLCMVILLHMYMYLLYLPIWNPSSIIKHTAHVPSMRLSWVSLILN